MCSDVKELEKKAGKLLRVVFRNFPLKNLHPNAEKAAESAEAAGVQGKFWEMHDLLFEHQQRLGHADLLGYAKKADLDLDRFREELESGKWAPRVREHFRSGVVSGVNGTPTFFINGERYDGGTDLGDLLAAVTEASGG